ncbi:MAG: amino acid adenylation domain-containing protein [Jejuia sp.]
MSPTFTISGGESEVPNRTLHNLLLQQSIKHPSDIALVNDNVEITYGELQNRINYAAHYLRSAGLEEGQVVAICLERCPNLIITMFAVLQCGAAFIPIDTSWPKMRIKTILDDANCHYFISSLAFSFSSSKLKTILTNEISKQYEDKVVYPLDCKVKKTAVAYVIYTSGSTGRPKGVQVSHSNVVNLVYSLGKKPGISRKDKVAAVTTIAFDAMVMETFLPLIHGASIVFVNEEIRRDGKQLLSLLENKGITIMWGTPGIWQILIDTYWKKPLALKALIGGEAVPKKLSNKLLDKCDELWNIYGPTETTVCAFLARILKNDESITIGKPIDNTYAYILDKNKQPVARGEVGEIVIGGAGVSLGYLNREELTADKFKTDIFNNTSQHQIYFSGDLGKELPNGDVLCLGRIDDQVKVRGYRIELGEIEKVMDKIHSVTKAVVCVDKLSKHENRLVAYLKPSGESKNSETLRKAMEQFLPEYMIPAIFIWVDEFSLTSNGKVDKTKLPKPFYARPENALPYSRPRTEKEKDISKIWSEYLKIPQIGIDDNFFEMGGSSIIVQKVASAISLKLIKDFSATKIYQLPTIRRLSDFYATNKSKPKVDETKTTSLNKNTSKDIAIIGMSGRFPGAETIEELWYNLKHGKETISFFSDEELDKTIHESLRNDPLYVKARGIVPTAKTFDAKFFGLSPKVAEAMDPQQRLFLEIAWEVLEASGYLPKVFNGSIGVYAGTGTNTYYTNNVLPNHDVMNQIGQLQASTLNEKDYIATRTAYHLNLTGPAVSVQSACSTSLLAIAKAVDALRNGHCDVALAGGSSVTAPMHSGHLYQEGAILSPDGHCKTFDADGNGTVFSDGAGVVLLKPLELAKKDGDIIYGTIKGIGINNDGGEKGSFTAPSVQGQADVISRALYDASVTPEEITYIEAHGTATPLGDPIEIEGLKSAFGKQEENKFCAIGSIKSNIGHLTAAAGVAGVIKTVLALYNKQIPASLGFQKPNPSIDFDNSPFYVNSKLTDWKLTKANSRIAGVSSFGVGGTNVHVILEEYNAHKNNSDSGSRRLQIIPWSAKSKESVEGYSDAISEYLENNTTTNLADFAYSLSKTRENFKHRRFIVASSNKEVLSKLEENTSNSNYIEIKSIPNEIVFMFPGQGAQYINMGKALYENEIVFREAVDLCASVIIDEFKFDIRTIIFPDTENDISISNLKNTKYTQPALFVIEYALSNLWMSWGIKPTLYCGHSVGEFVAAHLAGIFSLKDALYLITKRGSLVNDLPGGSMLSVRLSETDLTPILPKELSLAAVNSDTLCVVSGEDEIINNFSNVLKGRHVAHKLLQTSHAFHSDMMTPVIEEFKRIVESVVLNTPNIPIISTVTGKKLTDKEATSSKYWSNHLRDAVRFSSAMDTIFQLEDVILLEVGPGKVLTTLAKQKKISRGKSVLSSLPIPKSNEDDYNSLLHTLGQLWANGLNPDWKSFYQKQSRKLLRLPSYVFDKKPCWLAPVTSKLKEDKKGNTQNISSQTENHFETINVLETNTTQMRKELLLQKISEIILNSSGIQLEETDYSYSFIELGLDSLILTQIALTCKKEFNQPITFRKLNEDYNSPELLAGFLDETLPKDAFQPVAPEVKSTLSPNLNTPQMGGHAVNTVSQPLQNSNAALGLIAQQLQLLGQQMQLLQGEVVQQNVSVPTPVSETRNDTPASNIPPTISNTELTDEEKIEYKKPFGASPRIEKQTSKEVDGKQLEFLSRLTDTYNRKTIKSKNYAQEHRAHMSDPRVVSGFKPLTKELVYPLVIEKSSGNKLWDLDGNQYLDALNGFGSCIFGHQPDFVKEAVHKQVELGYEVGPQHPLAGEVCKLLCELTNHDRSALCNTGSEAVLGAMRIARTVTGRNLVVAFSRSYHGINDEGLVRGSKILKSFPAAAGITQESVQNMLILDYGSEESLQIIREKAHDIAAILVEPVQSRRPEFQPKEFIQELRSFCTENNSVLIFDEIITGFRIHQGGVQAFFGIKADLATYGKVIGGGLPIGAIAGKKEFMDALDGGFWQYGDDSFPEVGVTYFAGTFVRHPLALASCKASLSYLKEKGNAFQEELNRITEKFVFDLRVAFKNRKLPIDINYFGSLWRLSFTEEIPYSELLFVVLREKGIHIWDGFPCFMTEAFTKDDISLLKDMILKSCDEVVDAGILSGALSRDLSLEIKKTEQLNTPPLSGAKIGVDEDGNPAWYIEDVSGDGKLVKIEM